MTSTETGLDHSRIRRPAASGLDPLQHQRWLGASHPGMSAADSLAVLVARHLRYGWDDLHSPANDHLIFSKGHASPLLYAASSKGSAWPPTRSL